mmetsp:Transcript_4670/g.5715  ORF Transcript_4670/g.5715 Transcript_4670/m.5715 type:complete len:86 (+) Transcript_4670:1-258(+)
MLHTKAIVSKETKFYRSSLSKLEFKDRSSVGVEFPPDAEEPKNLDDVKKVKADGEWFYPNCYPVEWIDKYWSPKLNEQLRKNKLG